MLADFLWPPWHHLFHRPASLPPGSLWIWDSILVSVPRLHAIFPGPENLSTCIMHINTNTQTSSTGNIPTGRTLFYFNCTFTMTYEFLGIECFMEELPLCCPALWSDPQTAPELLLRCGLLCWESRQHFVQYIFATVAFFPADPSQRKSSSLHKAQRRLTGPGCRSLTWDPDGSLLLQPLLLFQRHLLLGSLWSLFWWCSLVLVCGSPVL